LYLEAITLMIIAVAMVFDRRDSFQSALVFGVLLILYMGLTPWSIMYFIIYPCYSLLTSHLKPVLREKEWLLVVYGFILSCSTGLILDLPFILVSELVTIYYILTGLKTSLIQGALTAMEIVLIYQPIEKVLFKIKEMHK
ncbi:MAG TPA: cytochrome B, partial [Erysipelotrichaceae bacterium]|nr:cytochrome B [Erysipelotrichaceae bacterium]